MAKQKVIINRGASAVAFTANERDIILAPESKPGRWGWVRVPHRVQGGPSHVLARLEGGPSTPSQYVVPVGTEVQLAGVILNRLLAQGCVVEDYSPSSSEDRARGLLERAQQAAADAGAMIETTRAQVSERDAIIAELEKKLAKLEKKSDPAPEPTLEPADKGSTPKGRSK